MFFLEGVRQPGPPWVIVDDCRAWVAGDRRQLVLPACCLNEKCYRNFNTLDPL